MENGRRLMRRPFFYMPESGRQKWVDESLFAMPLTGKLFET